jgi:hypothetical protein
VTRLLGDHGENHEAKRAVVERPATAPAAKTAVRAVMRVVLGAVVRGSVMVGSVAIPATMDVPAVALLRAVGVVMAESAASVSMFHRSDIVSIYRKSRYIEIVTVLDFSAIWGRW